MVPCEVCGNEIPDDERVCRWCGSHQHGVGSAARARGGRKSSGSRGGGQGGGGGRGATRPGGGRAQTLNLESGRPATDQAVGRLDLKLDTWRRQGVRLVRVIHGYGSSGRGGAIRDAVRRHLGNLRSRGLVKGWVAGEDYPDGSGAARALLNRHPGLRSSLRTDRGNAGITFVEL